MIRIGSQVEFVKSKVIFSYKLQTVLRFVSVLRFVGETIMSKFGALPCSWVSPTCQRLNGQLRGLVLQMFVTVYFQIVKF